MRKIFTVLFIAGFLLVPQVLCAQQNATRLNATTNGTVINMGGAAITVRDDDSQGEGAPLNGSPTPGTDYYLTVTGGCPAPSRLGLFIEELSLSCLDTLFLYDGTGTSGTLIAKMNSFTGNYHEGDYIFETPANFTGQITIRLKMDSRTDSARLAMSCFKNNQGIGKGFKVSFICMKPCEKVVPVIDSKFYRTRGGVIYDSAYIHEITVYDTMWYNKNDHSQGYSDIVPNTFMGANLCIGDGVIFNGHGEFTHNYGYYNPSDANTMFRWDFDNEGDTAAGIGLNQVHYTDYQRTGCYDIRLDLVDAFGCKNTEMATIRVRTAMNPIKTIYRLADICTRDSLPVTIGYGEGDATITLARIISDTSVSKTFEELTFIPDGCDCATPSYFEAPVVFEEFPNNKQVQSAADICSICINMEHSFMGDITVTIVCPNGSEAVLKYGQKPSNPKCTVTGIIYPTTSSDASATGISTRLGIPLENTFDNKNNNCPWWENPYGIGLDYCFSRDTNYRLITGDRAGDVLDASNPRPSGNFYIGKCPTKETVSAYWPTIDGTYSKDGTHHFTQAGQTPPPATVQTRKRSNHDEKLDYYLPYTTFDELIGCPMNGEWKIRVYDANMKDNGWIFSWTLDICNYASSGCEYQVGIDSLIWVPDPSPQYHDYTLGYHRGPEVKMVSPVKSYIYTKDTAGDFPIQVHIYDEFGCVWDTTTNITSIWTPQPNLGPDTGLCGINQMVLDASDEHSKANGFSYAWSPYGEVTDTIVTADNPSGSVTYVVEATNSKGGTVCATRDTIVVTTRRQPLPSVIPIPFVLEGCDPFTLTFENRSINADEHLWIFGDGSSSSLAEPTHTYTAGTYDLRYYASSSDGCIDSIISPDAITVFPSPKAAFAWSPTYPSVIDPMVNLHNLTEPKASNNHYFWEIQYNRDLPLSVQTLTEEEPVFDITQYIDGNPAGNYTVRLIARSDNLTPTGNLIYCADTTENTILVINDFLQFPNVVTPNGDGVNDRFVITNLVDGIAFPINSLTIYNRWGTRVFHRENIDNDDDFWDPSGVPAGTYYFHFTARGYNGTVEHNGTIEVVK